MLLVSFSLSWVSQNGKWNRQTPVKNGTDMSWKFKLVQPRDFLAPSWLSSTLSSLQTPRLYCAANCEDLCEVVAHVSRLNPGIKLGATGISMGGLILGNYLAKHSEEAAQFLAAATIISAPWDVFKGSVSIEKPYLNNMLGRHLADSLCRTVSKYDILKGECYTWDMERVLQSKTIKEFDSEFTVKL